VVEALSVHPSLESDSETEEPMTEEADE